MNVYMVANLKVSILLLAFATIRSTKIKHKSKEEWSTRLDIVLKITLLVFISQIEEFLYTSNKRLIILWGQVSQKAWGSLASDYKGLWFSGLLSYTEPGIQTFINVKPSNSSNDIQWAWLLFLSFLCPVYYISL